MWGLLRTRRWISFTLTAILAIMGFGILSNWQWHRAQEEDAKSDALVWATQAAVVDIGALLPLSEDLPAADQWRTVTATGTFDCSSGYLIRNRPLNASNGFWVSCPLLTGDGVWLWVNRGWLPAPGPAIREIPMPTAPSGLVTVTGRLRPSQDGPDSLPADMPVGQAPDLDTAVLTTVAGLVGPAYRPYVEATAMDPADTAGLKVLPLPPADSAQNYSYAGQWLLFAAVAIGGWFYFLLREARDDAATAQAAGEVPSGTR